MSLENLCSGTKVDDLYASRWHFDLESNCRRNSILRTIMSRDKSYELRFYPLWRNVLFQFFKHLKFPAKNIENNFCDKKSCWSPRSMNTLNTWRIVSSWRHSYSCVCFEANKHFCFFVYKSLFLLHRCSCFSDWERKFVDL